MKSTLKFTAWLSFTMLFLLTFESCKKKDEEVLKIQSVVPQKIIDDLTNKGMLINQGGKPPKLSMAIRVSPYELLAPYGDEDNYDKGQVIGDYFYKFYGQTDNQDITYDFYNDGKNDVGAGKGAFIIGSGNKFTIFSEDIGVSKTVPYKTVSVISGELDGSSIKNFQFAFVMKEKTGDDDNSILIPVEEGRIWIDSDKDSEGITNFRVSATQNGMAGSTVSVK